MSIDQKTIEILYFACLKYSVSIFNQSPSTALPPFIYPKNQVATVRLIICSNDWLSPPLFARIIRAHFWRRVSFILLLILSVTYLNFHRFEPQIMQKNCNFNWTVCSVINFETFLYCGTECVTVHVYSSKNSRMFEILIFGFLSISTTPPFLLSPIPKARPPPCAYLYLPMAGCLPPLFANKKAHTLGREWVSYCCQL